MIVLDTNVVSELMRPSPAPVVVEWLRAQADGQLYTTSITLAEILFGVRRLPDGQRKERLNAAATEVFDAFADQVLPFCASTAVHYAEIVHGRERLGLPIDGFDAQIAAVCQANGAGLATRNIKDFLHTGVDLINPWRNSESR